MLFFLINSLTHSDYKPCVSVMINRDSSPGRKIYIKLIFFCYIIILMDTLHSLLSCIAYLFENIIIVVDKPTGLGCAVHVYM